MAFSRVDDHEVTVHGQRIRLTIKWRYIYMGGLETESISAIVVIVSNELVALATTSDE